MAEPIALSPTEVLCLEALLTGVDRKMLVALRVRVNLRQTARALSKLASLGLATTEGGRRWYPTPLADVATITDATNFRKRGRPPTTGVASAGASGTRLLALLHQPRRGAELATLLGVTRQRVHQLVVDLSAHNFIRSADPEYPTFAIALKNDPTILLRQDQERVLSSFPEGNATTLSKIVAVTNMPAGKVATVGRHLSEIGLIEKAGVATFGVLYRLTAAGAAHWQRSASALQADIPPPPFRSDRVHDVLSQLDKQGPMRTCDIGLELEIPKTSINALMQYLKRKNAVRTQTDARFAPYDLTPTGREILDAMNRAKSSRSDVIVSPARLAGFVSQHASSRP